MKNREWKIEQEYLEANHKINSVFLLISVTNNSVNLNDPVICVLFFCHRDYRKHGGHQNIF